MLFYLKEKKMEKTTKLYYTPNELIKLGFPRVRVYEIARKIGRKSSDSKRGYKYLLKLEEVERCL